MANAELALLVKCPEAQTYSESSLVGQAWEVGKLALGSVARKIGFHVQGNPMFSDHFQNNPEPSSKFAKLPNTTD